MCVTHRISHTVYNNTIQFTTIYNRIYTLQKDVTAGRLTHKLCKSSLAAGSFLLLEELLDVQDMGTDVRGICVALLFYVVEYGLQVLSGTRVAVAGHAPHALPGTRCRAHALPGTRHATRRRSAT